MPGSDGPAILYSVVANWIGHPFRRMHFESSNGEALILATDSDLRHSFCVRVRTTLNVTTSTETCMLVKLNQKYTEMTADEPGTQAWSK
jgi:hypothetical protein